MVAIRNLSSAFPERLQQRVLLGRVFGASEAPTPAPEPPVDESETP